MTTTAIPQTPAESAAWNIEVLERCIADVDAVKHPGAKAVASALRSAKVAMDQHLTGEAHDAQVCKLIGIATESAWEMENGEW